MKTKSTYWLISLLLIQLLAGCANPPAVTSSPSPVPTKLPVITPTLAALPTVLPSNTPDLTIVERCLEIKDYSSLSTLPDIATGTVVIGKEEPHIYLLDLSNGTRYEFSYSQDPLHGSGMQVSPDGNNLAYNEDILDTSGKSISRKLWVINARGEILVNKSFGIYEFGQFRWLDDRYLQVYTDQTLEDGTVAIFDLDTEKLNLFSPSLPSFHRRSDAAPPIWIVEYSPNQEYAVYYGDFENTNMSPMMSNLITQQVIWQFPARGRTRGIPLWSPMGNQVAMLIDQQLYLVDTNGQVVELPKLKKGNNIFKHTWSPDGSHIVFWAARDQETRADLMVYDLDSKQVIDYCIEADNPFGSVPVWSTNGLLFTVTVVKRDANSTSSFRLLVDVQKNVIYKISKEMQPLEWMNSP